MFAGSEGDDGGPGMILFGFMSLLMGIWLMISACTPYKIIKEKKYTLVTTRLEGVPHQFVKTSSGTIDIEQTFGQMFYDGSIMTETKLQRSCYGIYWNKNPQYVYEITYEAPYKPVVGPTSKIAGPPENTVIGSQKNVYQIIGIQPPEDN